MSEAFSLAGRVAVVTGAGAGIGEHLAIELGALGAGVGVLDVDEDGARACAQRIEQDGGRALAVACDVSDYEGIQDAFAEVRSELGETDILVNNAGIISTARFSEMEEAEWDRIFGIDYSSLFNCCKAVVPSMTSRSYGRIVNVSSVAGKRGGGLLGTAAYSAAKAGAFGFTKALARELAPSGVTVNAVAPAAVITRMSRKFQEDPELLAKVLAGIPVGRQGTVVDISDAVTFLVSDVAGYITGETLNVEGGLLME